ncbi:MAG: c-type cytochrome domain-containing protein [Cyclobacteriaceae bacterium]
MFSSIAEFFGHFHPLVVHLPIGILLMAVLLHWLSGNPKFHAFRAVVPFVVLCGMITAIIACISGYLLSISDDYNETLVGWHKWMGISVALVSILWYFQERNFRFTRSLKYLSGGLFVLIMITGHLGGVLTHGSDYLTGPLADIFSDDPSVNSVFMPVADVQEAVVYTDLVQPLLQAKCYSCHGRNKQKGGLRMDDTLNLTKGGDDGVVIKPHDPDDSEMVRRILLPVDNDDHMPPREKGQLTESQISLLHWWIDNGADFKKKAKEFDQPEKMESVLLTFQEIPDNGDTLTFVPEEPVAKADEKIFDQLNERGIMVLPVGRESNYISANFFTDTLVTDQDMELLLSLKKQLIWLKIGFTDLNDAQMSKISQLTNLTRLSMEHTPVSDEGIGQLKSCSQLQYLNIVGTPVTAKGILALKELPELRSIYVYQTGITQADWPELESAFSATKIDSGGYKVPTFATDTTEVKFVKK